MKTLNRLFDYKFRFLSKLFLDCILRPLMAHDDQFATSTSVDISEAEADIMVPSMVHLSASSSFVFEDSSFIFTEKELIYNIEQRNAPT
mmetsp:Transcript_503/g.705  ORF Transcript_503/g.705 Transcript_503/m.705 type:complete len:89 (+) Transcript_503:1309-1575(+)